MPRGNTHRLRTTGLGLLLVVALGACSDDEGDASGAGDAGTDAAGGPLVFTAALTEGETVPPRHKCPMSVLGSGTGDNLSPPLSWSGAPAGTQSFALVLRDTRYGVFHWGLWNIPADARELPEGIPAGFRVDDPAGARQGGGAGDDPHAYYGPCSDAGPFSGVYELRLYALDAADLELDADADGDAITAAIDAATLDAVAWEGTPE